MKKVHPAFYKKRVGKNQIGFNMAEIAISIDDRIEPLPFSLDSFTDDNPLVRQIKTNGLLIEGCV